MTDHKTNERLKAIINQAPFIADRLILDDFVEAALTVVKIFSEYQDTIIGNIRFSPRPNYYYELFVNNISYGYLAIEKQLEKRVQNLLFQAREQKPFTLSNAEILIAKLNPAIQEHAERLMNERFKAYFLYQFDDSSRTIEDFENEYPNARQMLAQFFDAVYTNANLFPMRAEIEVGEEKIGIFFDDDSIDVSNTLMRVSLHLSMMPTIIERISEIRHLEKDYELVFKHFDQVMALICNAHQISLAKK